MTYYENRAVLRDNDADVEIEVRGGIEADDVPGGYMVTIRGLSEDEHEKVLRVRADVWQRFVRAVGRLK